MKELDKKILIIDDEPKIVEAVEAYLKNSGYKTFVAFDGKDGIKKFENNNPDLVILDLMLPIISGEEVCSFIRKVSRIPIIMLTAKITEDDKINGLNLGADDYLTKPFSPRELVARVNSLIRRCSENLKPLFNTMSWNNNDLEINFESFTVKKSGDAVNLTPNEFKLFSTLIKHPNKTYTRDELIEAAFGIDFEGYDRTIDSHIKNLRQKIEDNSSSPQYIITVRGVGYKFGAT